MIVAAVCDRRSAPIERRYSKMHHYRELTPRAFIKQLRYTSYHGVFGIKNQSYKWRLHTVRQFKWSALSIALLAVLMVPGCAKKPVGLPASEIPPDGVSSVPQPAAPDFDMPPVDPAVMVAGAVKEVKSKVLDKEADDKTKSLIHIKVLALDGPVDISDNTRWEIWAPGSDPEEQKPEVGGWASAESAVPPGTWDVRLHYEEGPLLKVDGWIRNITFTAGKLWKAEVVFAAPEQYVRVFGKIDGYDVADNMHIDLFKAGSDQQQPLTSFWSTQKIPLPAGSYDLVLTYDKDTIKAKGMLKGLVVGGNHGILKTTGTMARG